MNKCIAMLTLYVAALPGICAETASHDLANFVHDVLVLADPNQKLSSRLISETLGIKLSKHCGGPVPYESGAYYFCNFYPKDHQAGSFLISEFNTASFNPNPDEGGSISWTVDQNRCFNRELLSNAFKTDAVFPRFPTIGEAFSKGETKKQINYYDLIIFKYPRPNENTFIAISEENGCARNLKLYKNETKRQ